MTSACRSESVKLTGSSIIAAGPMSCRELLAAGAGCFMVNLSNMTSEKGFYLILYLSNSQSCE